MLEDAERLTSVGKIVRKTSLDEIPQLLNVLKGDMSLIGPRPLLPEYLPLYDQEQKKRHQVKPGITGWAQVNGRNAISWEDKFKYDVEYVERLSLALDLKILYLTFKKVFKGDGISQANQATAEKFKGNLNRHLLKFMKEIAIIGAGGFGREVKMLIDQINREEIKYDIIGFYDDDNTLPEVINGVPFLGKLKI